MGPLLSKLEVNGAGLLSEWVWLVPAGYMPAFRTAFGDLFLRSPKGGLLFLDTLGGSLVEAADTEAELLEQLSSNEELRSDVLMPSLAESLEILLGPLVDDTCYSVKVPLSLGGTREPGNFAILPLSGHLAALGRLQRQVANDPPGTKYRPLHDG